MTLSPTIDRRRFVDDVSQRARENSGMLVVVSGASGTGKSRTLRDVGDRLGPSARVHYVAADEFEQTMPFAFVERLLRDGLDHGPDLDPGAPHIDVARRLIGALVAPHQKRLRTVLLDDAQWIDADSARVLRYAVPRTVGRGVMLVVADRQPFAPGSLGEHLAAYADASGVHAHRRLEPLSVDQIRALALERFGTGISPRVAEELREATGGTFLGIDRLFDGLTPAEVGDLHRTWVLPIRGAALPENPFLTDYARLEPAARLAVEIASAASREVSRPTMAAVAAALGESIDVAAAVAGGALVEGGYGGGHAVAHSLIGTAVREAAGPARVRRLNRELAEATDGYPSIMHALRGAEEWSDELGARADAFVAEAAADSRRPVAAEVLRASLAVATGAERERLMLSLALHRLHDKQGFAVLDLYDDIAALPPSALRDCIVVVLLIYRFEQDEANARLRELLGRRTDDPDTRTIQSFLAFMSMIILMRSGDQSLPQEHIRLAAELWRAAPEDATGLTDQRLAWMAAPRGYEAIVAGFGIVSLHLESRIDELRVVLPSLIERARALPDSDLKIDALVPLAGAAAATGDIALAHSLAAEGMQLLSHVDSPPWAGGTIRFIHAHTLVLLGRTDEAALVIEQSRDLVYDVLDVETRQSFAALEALVRAVTGAEHPAAPLEEAGRLDQLGWDVYGVDTMVLAEGLIASAVGDPHGVLAATEPRRIASMRNTQRGFLTLRAHALIDLGRMDEADELLAQLELDRGTKWLETAGTLAWLRARRAEAGGDDEAAAGHYAAAVADGGPALPLAEALTLMDYGAFLARVGSSAEAEEHLRGAVARLERMGAGGFLPAARAALDAVAAPERRERAERVGTLTPREREVARLLAGGRTNARVAEELFVSQATARFHVANVLRKLGLSRRSEVGAAVEGLLD